MKPKINYSGLSQKLILFGCPFPPTKPICKGIPILKFFVEPKVNYSGVRFDGQNPSAKVSQAQKV